MEQDSEEQDKEEQEKKEEKRKKEEKQETKEEVKEEIREIPVEIEPSHERIVPILEEKKEKEEKLEDFLKDVETEKPAEEKKTVPSYVSSYKEEEEPKYTSTQAQRFEVKISEETRLRRVEDREELKTPLLREIGTGERFEEVVKYESKKEDSSPVSFEPEFKHDKKIRKYKKRY